MFLLAEWESRELHTRAFDATYAWTWSEAVHRIAMGRSDLEPLRVYYAWDDKAWPRDSMRMTFVTNHDINAWEGTEYQRFGDALDAAIVLSVIGTGIPMIYNGQEAGGDKQLAFFSKEPLQWRDDPAEALSRRLFSLKRDHPALWNGAWGARMVRVPNSAEESVLSFVRSRDDDGVVPLSTSRPTPDRSPWETARTSERTRMPSPANGSYSIRRVRPRCRPGGTGFSCADERDVGHGRRWPGTD